MMTTNNQYYKTIAEKLTSETITGTHSNNYYLHIIALTYGYTYTGTTCNGKYIKDIASAVTGETYMGNHFNNYYLKEMAEYLTEETYLNRSDNYLLGVIAEHITPSVVKYNGVELSRDKEIISYNGGDNPESATLTAQLTLDGEDVRVSGETVTFEVRKQSDDSLVETLTGDTDSSGVASVTYTANGIGNVYVEAKIGILVSETYEVQDMIKYIDETNDLSETFNISLPNDFEVSCIINSPSSGTRQVQVVFNNAYRCIKPDSNGKVGIANESNGSWIENINVNIPYNTDVLVTLTYQNGITTLGWGEYSITRSDIQLTTLTRMLVLKDTLKEFKIKPL